MLQAARHHGRSGQISEAHVHVSQARHRGKGRVRTSAVAHLPGSLHREAPRRPHHPHRPRSVRTGIARWRRAQQLAESENAGRQHRSQSRSPVRCPVRCPLHSCGYVLPASRQSRAISPYPWQADSNRHHQLGRHIRHRSYREQKARQAAGLLAPHPRHSSTDRPPTCPPCRTNMTRG